jgi:hypothetical protein
MKIVVNPFLIESRSNDAIMFIENTATIKRANRGHLADQIITKFPTVDPFAGRISFHGRNLASVETRSALGTAQVTMISDSSAVACLYGMADFGPPVDSEQRKYPPRFPEASQDTIENRYQWLKEALIDANHKVPLQFSFSGAYSMGSGCAYLEKQRIFSILENFETQTNRSVILYALSASEIS